MTVEFSLSNPPYCMLGFTPTRQIEGLPRNEFEGVAIDTSLLGKTGLITPECIALLLMEIAGTAYLTMGQNIPNITALVESSTTDKVLTLLAISSPILGPVASAALSTAIISRGPSQNKLRS